MKAAGYIFLIIIQVPLWIVQWLFKRKALAVIIIVVVLALVAVNAFNNQTKPQSQSQSVNIPSYQEIAPKTPYVAVTPSRVYYVNSYQQPTTDIILLTDYFFYDTKQWEHSPDTLLLKSESIKIIKR